MSRLAVRSLKALVAAVSTLAFAASVTTAQAQGLTITGRVVSDAGLPLFGANVTIDALQISVGTNQAGQYTITVPGARVTGQSVILRARSIGFSPAVKTITVSAGAQTQNFELRTDVNRLDQVVVTGVATGTEIKKLPFAVAQVSSQDMPVPGSNPLSQLQGKVPGANIVSATGRPGSAPAVILRGPQSINATGRGQDPLYIIDGVISQGGLQDINPQDIESVEVVKGAAASSLYGSRAGNGVIQITTRSGKNVGDGVKFRSQMEYGQSDIENSYQYPKTNFMLMNEDYSRFCIAVAGQPDCSRTVDIEAEALRVNNDGIDFSLPPATFVNDAGIARNPGAILSRGLFQTNPFPRTYNPIEQFVTNGETINATFDATGRVGRTNFFASANQFRQEGSVRLMDGYRRNSIRLNVDQQLAGNWNFSVRTNYTDVYDYNTAGPWFSLTRQPANVNLFRTDAKGRLFIRSVAQNQGAGNVNPAYTAQNFRPLERINRFIGQVTTRWAPTSWMDVEGNVGYDGRNTVQETQQDKGYRTTASAPATNLGIIIRNAGRSYSLNSSLNVLMKRDWFENKLNTRLTLRYLYEAQDDRRQNSRGENLAVAGLADPDAAIANFTIGGSSETVRQVGMFANVDADYKGRYILSGLVRRDGASLFGAARRWQTYGRGSVAWRASEEAWFPIKQVSDLKFRASVGQAGNRPNFTAQYETFTIGAGGALAPNTLGNVNLRPEVSTETEVGMDLEIKNKYGLTLTYANNVIDGQLLPVPPPAAAGFANQWKNVGELTNKTWEASLNIPIIQKKDLNYSARINFDRTTSLISRLDVPEFFYGANQQGAETMFKIVQGGRFGAMYGRKFVKTCGDLPSTHQAQCGAGLDYQRNSDGFIVYVGQGNTLGDGITKNLWFTRLPAASAPWKGGTNADALGWGLPILYRDSLGAVPVVEVGNALPDFRWSVSQQGSWKRWSAFVLLDATVGKDIWNVGRQWSLGDFMFRDADNAGRTVESAKPIGYYFRAIQTGGIGGLYDVLGPNNNTVEDASFVKVREASLGYRVGKLMGYGDFTVSLVGRNLHTFTKYKGFDPEVGNTGGALNSGVLNAVDAFVFPNLRQFTFQISTSF
ncbi:MAG: SusC/RagA family TonB-linked outer membrane protein [Gemmatimonadaceae bacterium]|nr:SusC/RagA family TonB-linked outer membrane protein [Gemmatimonadaceae bacterium]